MKFRTNGLKIFNFNYGNIVVQIYWPSFWIVKDEIYFCAETVFRCYKTSTKKAFGWQVFGFGFGLGIYKEKEAGI